MSWHGRRVTDPKPVVRAPLEEYGANPTKGLDPLYKGMDHAKSQLRNIEHRLQEAERHSNPTTAEDGLNVAVDRVPSYILNPTEQPTSILVDSSGKTRHLRSREELTSRKTSRLDDKYKERRQRSPLREPNQLTERKVAWLEDDIGSTATTTTGYKSATGSTLWGLSSLNTRGLESTSGSKTGEGTSINFINDKDEGVLTRDGGVRGYMDLPGRWTKVDVGVPGSSSTGWGRRTASGADPLASTYPPKASGAAEAGHSSRTMAEVDGGTNALAASGSSAASAPPNVNATYTLNGESSSSTSPNSSRFKHKKSLRDLEKSSDTLAKLREKVRQQKLLAASGESLAAGDKDLHITHSVNDPVVPRAPARPADPPVIVRKIAAGPPVPRYQGFSEAEMKYRLPDGKMVKVSDIRRRKLKKMRKEAPLKEVQGSLITETEDKKPSKALRVIAPPKKPAKADRQTGDIITTRSWRVGAKLVLQELGPNKLPKMSDSPPSKDKPDSETKDEQKPSSAPLSSAARSVLRDMEDSGSEKEEGAQKDKDETKKQHKRKRSKPPPSSGQQDEDDDKQQAKVRHYDSEEVKRFMARQRSERRQRQQEESARAEQLRNQRDAQLAELYKKQREGGRTAGGGAPRQADVPSCSATHTVQQEDGIKHSGESDKENRGGAWGEISSSESTLSGGSAPGTAQMDTLNDMDVDDSPTPKAGPSGGDPLMDTYKVTGGGADGPAAPGLRSADSGLGATATRFLADSGLKVDDILSRISGRASAIKSSFAPESGAAVSRSAASTMPTYLREPPPTTLPNTPFSASTTTAGVGLNSRQQRIRALAENSSLLAQRLASEQQRLASLGHSQTATERWALPREELPEEDTYRSRYDRMTGRNYNIYDSELPGVSSLSRPVPKSAPTDTGRVYQHMKSDDGMSDLSDSTLHEDDLYQPLPSTKYGAGKIRLTSSTVAPAGGRESSRARPAAGRWEEPRADPFSILNVLSRRKDPLTRDPYKRVGLFDDTEAEDELQADHTMNSVSDHHLSDNVSLSDDSTFTGEAPTDKDKSGRQRSHHSASHHSASQRSRSPVSVSQLSEDDSSLTDYTKSHHTESRSRPLSTQRSARSANGALSHRSERSVGSRHSPTHSLKPTSARSDKKTTLEERQTPGVETQVPPAPPEPTAAAEEEEDQDDTLEGPQSPSMASELDDKLEDGDDAALSVEISDVSESSDLSVADRSAGNRRAYAPGGIAYRPGLVSGRLSPGGLERRMTAELNLLDSMEESVRQLTKVDRTRGISMAQQESVSLAQILKAQEHGHAQQLSAYQRDSAQLTRELTNAHRTAASATENATQSIERARQETTRSLQESTMNLIATQSEAAKATAEAARQLAEVKVAASGAAANITNENTSRLIHDTAVATATAVSSVLHDKFGKRGGVGAEDHATQYSRRSGSARVSGDSYTSDTYESDFSQSATTSRSHTRSKPAPTSRPDSRVSYSMEVETASAGTSPAGTGSVKTGSVVTASDLSKNTASSIATESGAGGIAGSHDNSKSESIIEEVFNGKIPDDYSIDFDTSVTEEEMEKSLREMLPSQDHRKKIRKTSSQSDLSSIASDDHKEALNSLGTPSRRLSFEGDSFTKFQVDMVRQYMREEEIRAQHQGALLKLRERALKEKTQAELAWLEQQKTRGRDKGADEVYPLIKKKRRGLLLKLQQEQAEIRRLKEASKAASKERQFLLLQSQEIARLRQTTQQITQLTRRGGAAKVQQWLYDLDSSSLELDTNSSLSQVKEKIKSRPPGTAAAADALDIPTEDELNFNLDDSEILGLTSPSKDLDSEGGEKKADLKALQKLRKMKLDDKFLTQREQQLLQRRLQVEGLLEWKQKLDREEAEIEAMEKAALNLTKKDKAAKEKAAKEKTTKDKATKETRDKADKNDNKSATTPRTPRADTIASELDSIKEESYSESFTASTSVIRTRRTPRTDTDIPEDVPPDSARSRGSVSSIREQLVTNGQSSTIAEDIPTARSSGKRTPDSSEEANVTTSSTHEEYTNETFESDAGTATITSPAAPGPTTGTAAPPRLQLGAKEAAGSGRTAPRSPKSPLKSPIRRGSESESEDSISVAHSETASDQSDLENRIRALSEDLKRRKLEAERLKKEAKKNQKERLRQEELALKKQIEAYDKYIAEARLEITDDVELQERQPPQIKKPTPGQKRSPPSVHRTPNDTSRARIDSDGSRSNSSLENGGESPGQTTPLSPITPGGPEELMAGKAPSFVDSISESLMSPHVSVSGHSQKKTSTPDDKSIVESRSRIIDRSETIDEVPEEVSGLGGLEESESEVKLRLDISKTEDAPDSVKPPMPDTARSLKSITEDVPSESVQQSRPQSKFDESSAAHSKSEKVTNGMVSEKSIKSQYSTDFGDDSDRSASQKSDRSFTYSTSKNSRSNTSYTDEFTESRTGKSSPRRKDPTSYSKKSREESRGVEEEDSIQTEEEVSEQLDAESEDEEAGVMLDIEPTPLAPAVQALPDPLSHLSVGDRVLVGGARPGVLRFKGQVKFAEGFFGGVELNKPEGTNDGSRDGVEYFHCEPKHGLFAPPEKLEPLPANWKDEEPELSAGESDISEATIHDGEEDAEKIAELRKDVTRPDEATEPPALKDKDANESIAEDVSVATTVDSELERVISSAAAAVESFGAEQLEPHSGTTSPVDTTVSDALSPRDLPTPAPALAPLEKVVDSITDGILHMVVQDSVQSAGEVAQKIVAKRQSAASPPPPHTAPTEAVTPAAPTAETAPAAQTQPKQDSSSDSAVEVATQKLLSESISQMLSIYKKKQNAEVPEEAEEKPSTSPMDGSMDPAQEAREVRQPDILTLDDAGFDPFPGLSDGFGAGKDDLDQLYDELGALTGDTDEWFDDDFGLGLKKRAPPPYPGTQQEKLDKSDSSELRLDLRRVNQEPFFAVPHRAEDVRSLTTKAVTYFWELRRFGESWSDVTAPPDDYFRPDELRAVDMESGNRRAYKQLVFDLTAEVLHDIYQAEEAEQEREPCSWMPPRRCRQKYYRGRDPPTIKDMVEPVVEDQVLRLTGLKPRDKADVRLTKWSSRKKRDRVDNVLLQELVEEEPDWVDYNEDETTVKMQIADSIFDSLLVETASVFTSIAQRRAV